MASLGSDDARLRARLLIVAAAVLWSLSGALTKVLREPTPLANLHLTILDKVGAGRKAFGDSTGTIAGF